MSPVESYVDRTLKATGFCIWARRSLELILRADSVGIANQKIRMNIKNKIAVATKRASIILIIAVFIFAGEVFSQEIANANSDQENANKTSPAPTVPTPIPFSDIVAQSQSASASLKELDATAAPQPGIETVERELPGLTEQIDVRLAETARMIEGRVSLERLRSFESEWKTSTADLSKWKRILTDRAKNLAAALEDLRILDERWKATFGALQTVESPPEAMSRVGEIISNINRILRRIETEQSQIVALQSKVAEQQTRVDDAVALIGKTRVSVVGSLFVQDSPAVWSDNFWTRAQTDIAESANQTFAAQTDALSQFVHQNIGRLIAHLFVFIIFAAVLIFLRRAANPWVEKEPELKQAAIIFYLPVSTAIILAIFITRWIYPLSPQLLQAIFGAIVLIPTVIIVRKLVERPIYPILYSLVVFYLVDQVRMVAEALPVFSRLLFMTEMLGGVAFFLWINLGRLSKDRTEELVHGGVFRTIKLAATIAVPIFALAFVADMLGFVVFARLLGNAVLRSAYVAVILYAFVRIVDGLIIFALRFRPLSLLGMVQNNRSLIQLRLRRGVRWLGMVLWAAITLDLLALRQPLYNGVWASINSELKIGSFAISLGDIFAFVIAVWMSFLISRFVRFALNEDVYPRVNIGRGLPYAISTMLHYALLVLGFILALAIIGVDLTKFTIIAGAFGVGIGFGLQNIVNNFVSGLILLFERPVNVGDTIQVGEDDGELARIGLRASVLRTFQGSEVIVPNGDLISSKVVNWTLSDQQRRIEINVGVAYGTDPRSVIEILTQVGADHTDVLKDPGPRALFIGFGDSSLDFQLRAWTDKFDHWVVIKSDLSLAIHDALRDRQIEIPFPQRDLRLVSLGESVEKALQSKSSDKTE